MSMFDKIKGLFIEEDPSAKAKPNKPSGDNKKAASKSTPIKPVDLDKIDTTGAKSDSKFVDVLMKAIEANNMDGFDYLEYKQSLQSLANMSMDEKTRYQSAFAMAKTMGANPNKLVSSAQHYMKVLQTERKKFNEALQNQRAKQVTGKEKEMSDLEKAIVTKQKQIEKLTKEIEADKKKLEGIKGNINQSAAKVESTNEQFLIAYKLVVTQIESDVQKMKDYLK